MPIFDFHCADCDRTVEVFVQGRQEPRCPGCTGSRLEKQISAFAVGGASRASVPTPGPAGCGSCGDPRGPGACARG